MTQQPAKRTHPIADRPRVWVEVKGFRFPGREHGWREHGRIRIVEYTVPVTGLRYYGEQPASRVTPRDVPPATDTPGITTLHRPDLQ